MIIILLENSTHLCGQEPLHLSAAKNPRPRFGSWPTATSDHELQVQSNMYSVLQSGLNQVMQQRSAEFHAVLLVQQTLSARNFGDSENPVRSY